MSQRIVQSEPASMKRFENILLCLKQPESPDALALERTVELAKRTGASVELLTVVEESSRLLRSLSPAFSHIDSLIEDERRDELQALAARIEKEVPVSTKIVRGRPHIEIIKEALRGDHDLVVITARNEAGHPSFFGTSAVRLMRKCPCPLWVMKPGSTARTERILVALDLLPEAPERTALNTALMELATSLGEFEGARLHVLHVWDLYGESLLAHRVSAEELSRCIGQCRDTSQRALDKFMEPFRDQVPEERIVLEKGDAGDLIPRFVKEEKIDLVVMGTVARSGIPGFIIGNTAEKVLSQIECSVLAVKPEDFVSPVSLD